MQVLRQTFGRLVAPVALGTMMAASVAMPAFANDAADAPVRNASISVPAPTQKAVFTQLDDRTRSIAFVEADASEVSSDKPVVVIWGGSPEAMKQAYLATKALNDEGMDIGFILAPNRQTSTVQYDVEIQIYAKGGPVYNGGSSYFGGGRLSEISGYIESSVKDAQARHFPQQIAQLNLK